MSLAERDVGGGTEVFDLQLILKGSVSIVRSFLMTSGWTHRMHLLEVPDKNTEHSAWLTVHKEVWGTPTETDKYPMRFDCIGSLIFRDLPEDRVLMTITPRRYGVPRASRQQQQTLVFFCNMLIKKLMRFGFTIPRRPEPEPTERIDGRSQAKTGKRGPTLKTRERAHAYKRIKDEHPEWSRARVAVEANHRERVDFHTAETVRYTYRAMGWKWERADRVR